MKKQSPQHSLPWAATSLLLLLSLLTLGIVNQEPDPAKIEYWDTNLTPGDQELPPILSLVESPTEGEPAALQILYPPPPLDFGPRIPLDADQKLKSGLRITFRVDKNDSDEIKLDLYLDGAMALADIPFDEVLAREALGTQGSPFTGDIFSIGIKTTHSNALTEATGNPLFVDMDYDGLPDNWQEFHGLEEEERGRYEDPDKDGINNLREYIEGTDPTRALFDTVVGPRVESSRTLVEGYANPALDARDFDSTIYQTVLNASSLAASPWSMPNFASILASSTTAMANATTPVQVQRWTQAFRSKLSDFGKIDTIENMGDPEYIEDLSPQANWGDNYLAQYRTYLKPEQTGFYIFRVSGDDEVELWLSNSASKFSRQLIAEVISWKQKYIFSDPAQTSAPVYLEAGRPYYMEVLLRERTGGDYINVQWKYVGDDATGNGATDDFVPIASQFLIPYDPNLEVDDQNGNDLPDHWEQKHELGVNAEAFADSDMDGINNSQEFYYGRDPNVADSSYLEGHVLIERYDEIEGTKLKDLYNSPKFPDSVEQPYEPEVQGEADEPTRYFQASTRTTNQGSHYGMRMRGFIIPSKTGVHKFRLSTDDQGVFRMSIHPQSSYDPELTGKAPPVLQTMANIPGYASSHDFTKYPGQYSQPLYLIEGEAYAFEALMKEHEGYDHIHLQWSQPGDEDNFTIIEGTNLRGPHIGTYVKSLHPTTTPEPLGNLVSSHDGASLVPGTLGGFVLGPRYIAKDFRGSIAYDVSLPESNFYTATLHVKENITGRSLTDHLRVRLYMDGKEIHRGSFAWIRNPATDPGVCCTGVVPEITPTTLPTCAAKFKLPYLPAGPHKLEFQIDNEDAYRYISIERLEIHQVPAAPADEEIGELMQRSTTLATYVEGATTTTIHSYTSPVFIEGRAQHRQLVNMTELPYDESEETVVNPYKDEPGEPPLLRPAPLSGFFSNIPLYESHILPTEPEGTPAPRVFKLTYENNVSSETFHLLWKPLDLLDPERPSQLDIRFTDALLLKIPATGPQLYEDGIPLSPNFNGNFYKFEPAATGEYTFTQGQEQLVVNVYDAEFSRNPIVDVDKRQTTWANPNIVMDLGNSQVDSPIFLEHDRNLDIRLENISPEYTPDFSIGITDHDAHSRPEDLPTARYVVARLYNGGPILAVSEVRPIKFWAEKDTGYYRTKDAQGNSILEMPVVVSDPWSNLIMHFEVHHGGAEFIVNGEATPIVKGVNYVLHGTRLRNTGVPNNLHYIHFKDEGSGHACRKTRIFDHGKAGETANLLPLFSAIAANPILGMLGNVNGVDLSVIDPNTLYENIQSGDAPEIPTPDSTKLFNHTPGDGSCEPYEHEEWICWGMTTHEIVLLEKCNFKTVEEDPVGFPKGPYSIETLNKCVQTITFKGEDNPEIPDAIYTLSGNTCCGDPADGSKPGSGPAAKLVFKVIKLDHIESEDPDNYPIQEFNDKQYIVLDEGFSVPLIVFNTFGTTEFPGGDHAPQWKVHETVIGTGKSITLNEEILAPFLPEGEETVRLPLTVSCGAATLDLSLEFCAPYELTKMVCWENPMEIVELTDAPEGGIKFLNHETGPDGFPEEEYTIDVFDNDTVKDTYVMAVTFEGKDGINVPDAEYYLEGETMTGCKAFVTFKVFKLHEVQSTSHEIETFVGKDYIFIAEENKDTFSIDLEAFNTFGTKDFPHDHPTWTVDGEEVGKGSEVTLVASELQELIQDKMTFDVLASCGDVTLTLTIALCDPLIVHKNICWGPESETVVLEQPCTFTDKWVLPEGFPEEGNYAIDGFDSATPVTELVFRGDPGKLPDAIYEVEGETEDGCPAFVRLTVLKLDHLESLSPDYPVEESRGVSYIFIDPDNKADFLIDLEAKFTFDIADLGIEDHPKWYVEEEEQDEKGSFFTLDATKITHLTDGKDKIIVKAVCGESEADLEILFCNGVIINDNICWGDASYTTVEFDPPARFTTIDITPSGFPKQDYKIIGLDEDAQDDPEDYVTQVTFQGVGNELPEGFYQLTGTTEDGCLAEINLNVYKLDKIEIGNVYQGGADPDYEIQDGIIYLYDDQTYSEELILDAFNTFETQEFPTQENSNHDHDAPVWEIHYTTADGEAITENFPSDEHHGPTINVSVEELKPYRTKPKATPGGLVTITATCGQASDSVVICWPSVDLDIDSNNDNWFEPAGYESNFYSENTDPNSEDADEQNSPGKYVFVTTGDNDDDGVLDEVDGCGIIGGFIEGFRHVPLSLKFPQGMNLEHFDVSIIYDTSVPRIGEGLSQEDVVAAPIPDDPNKSTKSTKGLQPKSLDQSIYVNTDGLRLWTEDGSDHIHTEPGGHFIDKFEREPISNHVKDLLYNEDTFFIQAVNQFDKNDPNNTKRGIRIEPPTTDSSSEYPDHTKHCESPELSTTERFVDIMIFKKGESKPISSDTIIITVIDPYIDDLKESTNEWHLNYAPKSLKNKTHNYTLLTGTWTQDKVKAEFEFAVPDIEEIRENIIYQVRASNDDDIYGTYDKGNLNTDDTETKDDHTTDTKIEFYDYFSGKYPEYTLDIGIDKDNNGTIDQHLDRRFKIHALNSVSTSDSRNRLIEEIMESDESDYGRISKTVYSIFLDVPYDNFMPHKHSEYYQRHSTSDAFNTVHLPVNDGYHEDFKSMTHLTGAKFMGETPCEGGVLLPSYEWGTDSEFSQYFKANSVFKDAYSEGFEQTLSQSPTPTTIDNYTVVTPNDPIELNFSNPLNKFDPQHDEILVTFGNVQSSSARYKIQNHTSDPDKLIVVLEVTFSDIFDFSYHNSVFLDPLGYVQDAAILQIGSGNNRADRPGGDMMVIAVDVEYSEAIDKSDVPAQYHP